MYSKGYKFVKASFILMVAALTIAGCGARVFTFKGETVTRKDFIVQLENGNQQGVWKTNELSIKYQYNMTHEALNIAGTTELVGGFAIGFNAIKRLAVYLLFLDDQGIVIENALIFSTGNYLSTNMIPMLFEKMIPVPVGVRAISFAYDGELVDSGDEDTAAYSIGFWPWFR